MGPSFDKTHTVWCNAASGHYFCTNKIPPRKKAGLLIPLAKMIVFMRGTKSPNRFLKYSKLKEIFFFKGSIPPPKSK
jgi:hypothetical protein